MSDPLLNSVARFCAFICTEPFHDGKLGRTITVYFAGMLGIAQNGLTFERPGSPAPVTDLLSLRAYGRVLARADGPAFRFDWIEDGSSIKSRMAV